MLKYVLVSLGAAVGGALRYWLSNYVYKFLPENFPYGTLAVNVIGSFLVGFFIFYLSDREIISTNLKLLLTVGFCGGFTTFSTFSLETVNLLHDSEFLLAGFNILLNFFLCLLGVYLAYLIFKAN
jgi:CrcB protein